MRLESPVRFVSPVFLFICFLTTISISSTEFECFQYGAHRTDRTMYRLKERGDWKNLTCRTGTVWDTHYCYCAADPNQDSLHNNRQLLQAHCNNFRAVSGQLNMYEQEVQTGKWEKKDCQVFDPNLTWNQTMCQCVQQNQRDTVINLDPDSTACDTMFDSCFDTDTFTANGNTKWYIEMTDENKVRIVDDSDAYNGKAVYIGQAPLLLPTFLRNELSESFQIYVRFRLEETEKQELLDMYQIIFSNKCENQSATISCSYQPRNYTYRIVFQNATQSYPVIQECRYQAGDRFTSWKSVYILYQDGELVMSINGKPCLQFDFIGYPTFSCPMAIGGYPSIYQDGVSDEANILGYVDVMSVDRNCRSPIP